MCNSKIYRVIDANINRTREGLRVMEDLCRYVFDDKRATKALKDLRTKLTAALKLIPEKEKLIFNREVQKDVGRKLNPKTEFLRTDCRELFEINSKRLEEALRSLEEFSKFLSIRAAKSFKELRYRAYKMEKDVTTRLLNQ